MLAGERTELAWWRTGLTSLAVAVGVGRVVPELQDSGASWPYLSLGAGFAIYGIALFLRGTIQARAESETLGRPIHAQMLGDIVLASAGPLLGLAVIALITLA